jgi:hypothetical protein
MRQTMPYVEGMKSDSKKTWTEYQAYVATVRARNVGKIDREQAIAWTAWLRGEVVS